MSIPQSGGGPIESFEQLAAYMASGCKPKDEWRIGTEHEKFGWLTDSRRPLPYAGDRSIKALFDGLTAQHGWEPMAEGDNVIGLKRGGAQVSEKHCNFLINRGNDYPTRAAGNVFAVSLDFVF